MVTSAKRAGRKVVINKFTVSRKTAKFIIKHARKSLGETEFTTPAEVRRVCSHITRHESRIRAAVHAGETREFAGAFTAPVVLPTNFDNVVCFPADPACFLRSNECWAGKGINSNTHTF